MTITSLNRFNGIAPMYDRMARFVFGQELERAKRHYLNYIKDGDKVLYLGGGTGSILQDLTEKHHHLEIDFVEASDKMIELAKAKASHAGTNTINWIHGTEEAIPHTDHYDIVITNFLLDLFKHEDLLLMMPKIGASLKQGGFWIFTDFHARTKGLKNRILVHSMYFFFRMIGAVKGNRLLRYGLYFEKIGFRRMAQERFYKDLVETRVYGRYLGEG